ncbi:unnamed protein product [Dovyalis caffra]|uniref:Uncharacterized protein n=1 Tax=Dovyalis caffra TaxID=77055 RepID=A0AAV1RHS4_9ROSI|nr:unnamed protein product [Dovyalis caffra]
MGTEIYSYSLESQTWDCVGSDEKFSHFDFEWETSVVVDDVLYFYDNGSILSKAILAYDLVHKICLLHLGNGILCLLIGNPPVDENTIVDCIKFRVQKTVAGVVFMTALSEYALPLNDAAFVRDFFTVEVKSSHSSQ